MKSEEPQQRTSKSDASEQSNLLLSDKRFLSQNFQTSRVFEYKPQDISSQKPPTIQEDPPSFSKGIGRLAPRGTPEISRVGPKSHWHFRTSTKKRRGLRMFFSTRFVNNKKKNSCPKYRILGFLPFHWKVQIPSIKVEDPNPPQFWDIHRNFSGRSNIFDLFFGGLRKKQKKTTPFPSFWDLFVRWKKNINQKNRPVGLMKTRFQVVVCFFLGLA